MELKSEGLHLVLEGSCISEAILLSWAQWTCSGSQLTLGRLAHSITVSTMLNHSLKCLEFLFSAHINRSKQSIMKISVPVNEDVVQS